MRCWAQIVSQSVVNISSPCFVCMRDAVWLPDWWKVINLHRFHNKGCLVSFAPWIPNKAFGWAGPVFIKDMKMTLKNGWKIHFKFKKKSSLVKMKNNKIIIQLSQTYNKMLKYFYNFSMICTNCIQKAWKQINTKTIQQYKRFYTKQNKKTIWRM